MIDGIYTENELVRLAMGAHNTIDIPNGRRARATLQAEDALELARRELAGHPDAWGVEFRDGEVVRAVED